MTHRKRRKAIILSVYALLAFGIVWLIAGALRPAPSCTDGRQNQNETGVDCGGVCGACTTTIAAEPLKIEGSYIIDGVDGRVDAVAQITNPNHLFGASSVRYTFVLKDAQGTVIGRRDGATFILPAQTKYVLEPGIEVQENARVANAEFTITRTQWEVFDGYEEPRIVVLNKAYTLAHSDTVYSRVTGLVRNESPFDFDKIYVNVVLKDAAGTPIAIHRTRIDTFDSGMERDFSLPWPQKFPGDVATVDVDVEANVFDVTNYRKQYLRRSVGSAQQRR